MIRRPWNECGEDIDTVGRDIRASVSQGTRLFEQVKRRQANITLRSPISLEALANFADHRSTNPEWRLRFRLLTTAKIGREQHWQGDLEGIALWEAIRAGDLSEEAREAAVRQIRALLQESAAPERISAATWQILQAVVQSDAQFDDFIDDFEWSTSPTTTLRYKEGFASASSRPGSQPMTSRPRRYLTGSSPSSSAPSVRRAQNVLLEPSFLPRCPGRRNHKPISRWLPSFDRTRRAWRADGESRRPDFHVGERLHVDPGGSSVIGRSGQRNRRVCSALIPWLTYPTWCLLRYLV